MSPTQPPAVAPAAETWLKIQVPTTRQSGFAGKLFGLPPLTTMGGWSAVAHHPMQILGPNLAVDTLAYLGGGGGGR